MDGQYTEAAYILQLKVRIPRKGQHLLSGITSVSEAWQVLDNFYGNQETIVTSVVKRLLAAILVQGSAHKSLDQFCQVIHAATFALRAVHAVSCLENDQRLVATLVAKLPETYILDWDKHNTTKPPRTRATWRKFVG